MNYKDGRTKDRKAYRKAYMEVYAKEWHANHPNYAKEYAKKYYEENYWALREKREKKDKKDYLRSYYREHCEYLRELSRQNKIDNPERVKEERRRRWTRKREDVRKSLQKLRVEVFTHYGDGKLACVGCGFSDTRALTLDHINNNGAEERKGKWGRFINGGVGLYRRLRKEGYPLGYQTMCYNCNLIKYREYREENWVIEPPRARGRGK